MRNEITLNPSVAAFCFASSFCFGGQRSAISYQAYS